MRQSVLPVVDDNEMNVIGHQAIANQFCSMSLDALLQQGEIERRTTLFVFIALACFCTLLSEFLTLPQKARELPFN